MDENRSAALLFKDGNPSVGNLIRRSIDLTLAGTALVIFIPLMILVAAAICCESGTPSIFSQPRLGLRGRVFCMYKFRKFRRDCGTNGSPLTMDNDERLTLIGKFLQKTKLDELPQLWNIIIGNMSIVGPRPETLHFKDCFNGDYEEVLDYKPGIFGPSQVLFRNESSLFPSHVDPTEFYRSTIFPAKAKIDLAYYPRRTIVSDLCWILRGIVAVFGYVPPLYLNAPTESEGATDRKIESCSATPP
ncbi:sugar transferase [Microvirga sp. VF16]|uniref:sugar transferase n=1 Tax=Microvirga sp. VF16 TaxID=2807101 RepID=UPI00193E392B|nr:sugar transferase [Microvirga sp. VF16]QRM27251.1 sugar transferase [Microvirga sp. VF16]